MHLRRLLDRATQRNAASIRTLAELLPVPNWKEKPASSKRFLKRKEVEFVTIQHEIEALKSELESFAAECEPGTYTKTCRLVPRLEHSPRPLQPPGSVILRT